MFVVLPEPSGLGLGTMMVLLGMLAPADLGARAEGLSGTTRVELGAALGDVCDALALECLASLFGLVAVVGKNEQRDLDCLDPVPVAERYSGSQGFLERI